MALLSVMVPATFIEDGETLPAVGQSVEFALDFSEVDAAASRSAGPQLESLGVMEFEVVVEARLDPRRGGPMVHEVAGRPSWPTLVRGNGWAAGWSAPRPATGPMTLEGSLWATWDVVAGADTRTSDQVYRLPFGIGTDAEALDVAALLDQARHTAATSTVRERRSRLPAREPPLSCRCQSASGWSGRESRSRVVRASRTPATAQEPRLIVR